MKIGEKLKQRRKELGLTMLEVAKKSGVSEATVSRWESGDIANMKRDKIVLLAEALKTTPSFIMEWDEHPELILHNPTEKKLIQDYRSLSDQGKEYILQTMDMAIRTYKKQATFPKESSYAIAAWGADETETVQPPIDEITT